MRVAIPAGCGVVRMAEKRLQSSGWFVCTSVFDECKIFRQLVAAACGGCPAGRGITAIGPGADLLQVGAAPSLGFRAVQPSRHRPAGGPPQYWHGAGLPQQRQRPTDTNGIICWLNPQVCLTDSVLRNTMRV